MVKDATNLRHWLLFVLMGLVGLLCGLGLVYWAAAEYPPVPEPDVWVQATIALEAFRQQALDTPLDMDTWAAERGFGRRTTPMMRIKIQGQDYVWAEYCGGWIVVKDLEGPAHYTAFELRNWTNDFRQFTAAHLESSHE